MSDTLHPILAPGNLLRGLRVCFDKGEAQRSTPGQERLHQKLPPFRKRKVLPQKGSALEAEQGVQLSNSKVGLPARS